MDSRLKRIAIFGCVSMVLVLVIVVLLFNGISEKKESAVGSNTDGTASSASGTSTGFSNPSVNAVHGQVGNDLQGFLNDSTFFDPDKNEFLDGVMDMTNRLSIFTTSVEKDIRIQVLDYLGNLVKGKSFNIRLTDKEGNRSEYKDLDQDGVIYVGDLTAGNYEVELEPITGYKVPTNSTTVRVKEKVEYVVIDDISLLIKTEADIDAALEDSRVNEANSSADKTEMVSLQFGGSRRKVGIDVSKYQGDIDWEKVAAAGVEFVIIRAGYRGSVTGAIVKDPLFEQNIKGAEAAGLEVGVYFFTQAISEAEAVEEASAVITMVAPYKLKLPIYIDTEGAGGNGRADGLDAETRTEVCDAFCRTCVNAGYNGGVYASRYWLYNNLFMDRLNKYEVWLAEYVSVPKYTGYYTMWQHSSKGKIDGINGNVDLDIYYY